MNGLLPWLAVAGAGALHGLNPCTGWALATACGRRALLPLALGHAASVGLVAMLVARGLSMSELPWMAAAGVAGLLLLALSRRGGRRAGLAFWSFSVATVHGSGLMLVPALVPLCLSASPAREITASGSMLLAVAAVAVHMAAMLAVTAVVAWAARGGIEAASRRIARGKIDSIPCATASIDDQNSLADTRPRWRGIARVQRLGSLFG